MVYTLHTIIKAGAESTKYRQHGCAIFVICKTWMMNNGTAIPSPAEIFHQHGDDTNWEQIPIW